MRFAQCCKYVRCVFFYFNFSGLLSVCCSCIWKSCFYSPYFKLETFRLLSYVSCADFHFPFSSFSVDPLPSSASGPLPGGLRAALLLLLSKPRAPLLPGGRRGCALQQREGKPTSSNLRRQRKEPHCNCAQAGIHRGHALPSSHVCWPPGQSM